MLLGVITYDDLRQAMLDRGALAGALLAADLAEPTEVVTPTDSLREALGAEAFAEAWEADEPTATLD